jgi:antitoxin (DNA-binding transcriptional repressor) of toxin-antitoxin stability system
MVYHISLDEAKSQLIDLIEAALKGDDVFILKDDQQVVQLVPIDTPRRQAQFGSAAGLISMADDFDAPLEDFEAYMP